MAAIANALAEEREADMERSLEDAKKGRNRGQRKVDPRPANPKQMTSRDYLARSLPGMG